MEPGTVIHARNLSKVYRGQKAVDTLSFGVKEGEIFGFLGPNGAGKTTTLLMLLGLSQPSSGEAKVVGLDPLRNSIEVKRAVGYLPENVGFYNDMNALQTLEYIAALNGIPRDEAMDKADEALALVGLKESSSKKVGEYSRGMKQRLGIAEVLVKEPKVLFLDELTLGLDPEGALRLIDLIGALNRDRNITVILSSHNLHQVQRISHRVGIMIKGSMVAEGTTEALAKEKFGLDDKEYSLEEIYMQYFQEA